MYHIVFMELQENIYRIYKESRKYCTYWHGRIFAIYWNWKIFAKNSYIYSWTAINKFHISDWGYSLFSCIVDLSLLLEKPTQNVLHLFLMEMINQPEWNIFYFCVCVSVFSKPNSGNESSKTIKFIMPIYQFTCWSQLDFLIQKLPCQ